jgi:hypothetical protein
LEDFTIKNKMTFTLFIAVLIIVFSVLTVNRTAEWKSNLILFKKGVERSPKSSRAQYSLATEYLNLSESITDTAEINIYLKNSLLHFNKSLEILPENK